MTKLQKNRLKYVGINGTFAAALWYGFKVGIPWVAAVATGWIWFIMVMILLLLGILVAFNYLIKRRDTGVDVCRKFLGENETPNTVPHVVDFGFDVGAMYLLYITGHFTLMWPYGVVLVGCVALKFVVARLKKNCAWKIQRSLNRSFSFGDGEDKVGWDVEADNFANDDDNLFRMGIINGQGEDNG
jgi:hypothetical protein